MHKPRPLAAAVSLPSSLQLRCGPDRKKERLLQARWKQLGGSRPTQGSQRLRGLFSPPRELVELVSGLNCDER